jgi:adenine deaminase
MPQRFKHILANFKAIHESIEQEEQHTQPRDGMVWIMRDGKQTTCVEDSFSAIHGYNAPCNCGLMERARSLG